MKKLKLTLLFTFLSTFVVGQSLFAFDSLSIQGRTYTHSCEYFSQRVSHVLFTYKNEDLPWGTKVELEYGFEVKDSSHGEDTYSSWYPSPQKIQMKAHAPYTWSTKLDKTIVSRGHPIFFEGIDFVIVVTLPSGEKFWEKGNNSPMGHYKVKFPRNSFCATPTTVYDEYPYSELEIESVTK